MDFESLVGAVHEEGWTVTEELLADSLKSGTVRVFATPYMAALMEYAALMLVKPYLPEGITTVGTALNITHESATPVGMQVRAQAVLTETDGRRFVFTVTAWDEAGIIGRGTHERRSVKQTAFEARALEKLGDRPESDAVKSRKADPNHLDGNCSRH